MEFMFDEKKAAQAASVLLDRHGGTMPYIKLIKLLYLADRKSLIETAFPITGDRFISMSNGPVLSLVYDLIRYSHSSADSIWRRLILSREYDAVLVDVPQRDHLSDYEEDILHDIFNEHGQQDKWELIEFTHTLPEWTDPGNSSLPIDPEAILKLNGYTETQLAAAIEEADAVFSFRRQFAVAQ